MSTEVVVVWSVYFKRPLYIKAQVTRHWLDWKQVWFKLWFYYPLGSTSSKLNETAAELRGLVAIIDSIKTI